MADPKITIEQSHNRPRPTLRGDLAIPALENGADNHEPITGRFQKGNQAARRRKLKANARALATMNPDQCPEWLAPHAVTARDHAIQLAERFTDPILAPSISLAANHYGVAQGMLQLGLAGDGEAFKEFERHSKAYRTALLSMSAMWMQTAPERDEQRKQQSWLATISRIQPTPTLDYGFTDPPPLTTEAPPLLPNWTEVLPGPEDTTNE